MIISEPEFLLVLTLSFADIFLNFLKQLLDCSRLDNEFYAAICIFLPAIEYGVVFGSRLPVSWFLLSAERRPLPVFWFRISAVRRRLQVSGYLHLTYFHRTAKLCHRRSGHCFLLPVLLFRLSGYCCLRSGCQILFSGFRFPESGMRSPVPAV